jgi:hypothetical protein
MVSLGTMVSSATTASAQFPKVSILTPVSGINHPYFRVKLNVFSAAGNDYAKLDIYLGGKPY